MFSFARRFSVALLGCLLLLMAVPLRAQLDPRLQAAKTDFLDLYQQSSSNKAKPEIITIFDYSRSMASLMFHPLYVNHDVNDADDYRYMKFVLTNAVTGATPNNVWKITATSDKCSATATWTVTVTDATHASWVHSNDPQGTGNCTGGTTTAGNVTLNAYSAAMNAAIAKINLIPVSNSTAHTNYKLATTPYSNSGIQGTGQIYQPYTMVNSAGSTSLPTIAISASAGGSTGPWAPGTVLTLTVYLQHVMSEGEPAADKQITWSGGPGGATFTEVTTNQTYKSVATYTIPDFVPVTTTATPTQLKAINPSGTGVTGGGTNSGTCVPGNTVTLTTSYVQNTSGATKVTWAVSPSSQVGGCSNPVSVTSTASSGVVGTANTGTWPIPAYCGTNGASVPPYVTCSLDATVGSGYSVTGLTYPGALSSTTKDAVGYEALRKPDGTAVTATDATNASSTSGLYGATFGVTDVRNWIRAASHVRFKNGTRTIDIPIPWAIFDRTSSGTPLSTTKVQDTVTKQVTKSDGSKTNVLYGSQAYIETDQCYKINAGNGNVITADAVGSNLANTAQTTAYLWTCVYRPSYIAWLFNGQYQKTNPANDYYNTAYLAASPYIVFDAATANKVLGQTAANLNWGQAFGPAGTAWGSISVPSLNTDGSYNSTVLKDASSYRVPSLTRAQATKSAAISTWIAHQADVLWAFRFLDTNIEATGSSSTGNNPNIDDDSTKTIAVGDSTTTHTDGADSGWAVLNNDQTTDPTNSNPGNSSKGMARIASTFANGQTPLTYAMARTLAQYTDPNSVFNAIVGTNVSQCVNSYLILFTDGLDNNGVDGATNPSATPYISGTGASQTFNAVAGNRLIIGTPANINRTGPWWNLYTFAGIGAHLADASLGVVNADYLAALNPGSTAVSGLPSTFLPLAIYQRNFTPYSKPHRVTTMTVGVSLGGQYTDTTSPKRSLFLAAVMGDPDTNSGAVNSFHSFVGSALPADKNASWNDWIPSATDPTSWPDYGTKATGAVYFFDATDPTKLSSSLDFALKLAISAGGNNATSSPNLPYVGSTLGKQVYIGKFQTPKTGGVIWPGDLLMFGTRQAADGTVSLVNTLGDITLNVDQSTAQWSASKVFADTGGRKWYNRKLYTRLPGNATKPELGLHTFTDTGTLYSNAKNDPTAWDNTSGLESFVAVPALTVGSAAQQAVIQNAMGGDLTQGLDGSNRPIHNRTNLMGDIIDSSPASLEYNLTDATVTTGISNSTALSGFVGKNRFRLILVGTNQGWLHAFAEVSSKPTNIVDSGGITQQIITGVVDEAWAFMPTDFLANLSYPYGASSASNTHRFMVDGTPSIYFLDLPPTEGGLGNGILDYSASGGERAIALIGLGKGGRSYYALDIRDPFNPSMKWSLVPDEAGIFPHARNLTPLTDSALQTIIGNMGFATCTPGIGRVAFTSGGVTTLRDVVFLGGGLSVPEVEANFAGTLLGRSVLAIDVNTGEVLAAATLPNTSGPVVAGVVPFEYILNSGMAQRAYFLDRLGGLWAWGSMGTPASTDSSYSLYKDFRVDTSNLSNWTADGTAQGASNATTLRKVYQDGSGKNAIYTTLPAPFRVGSFPGKGKSGAPSPSAAGVAIVSGDRYNPVDWFYTTTTRPSNHRLIVVFDRQDSKLWGLDTNGITDSSPASPGTAGHIVDFSANTLNSSTNSDPCSDTVLKNITQGCDNFYLAPKTGDPFFGYFVNLPPLSGSFIPKGINPPLVIGGSLFYTYFTPTSADPCTGGNGNSSSNIICDVLRPVVTDNRSNIACKSGTAYTWSGVASNYSAFGTRGVFQGGTVAVNNPPPGGSPTTPLMVNLQGRAQERYPRARVWRTVQ